MSGRRRRDCSECNGSGTRLAWEVHDHTGLMQWPYTCNRCNGTGKITATTAPDEQSQDRVNDAEQIDDQVQDLLTTRMAEGIVELTGIWIEPDSESIRSIYRNFRKDLASLGIRLTYDTTIGGG